MVDNEKTESTTEQNKDPNTNITGENDNLNVVEKELDMDGDGIAETKANFILDDTQRFLVDDKYFMLPSMKDFYLGNIDDVLMKKIDAAVKNAEINQADPKSAAFYTEDVSPFKRIGLDGFGYKNNEYFLAFRPDYSDSDINDGFISGKTLNVNFNSLITTEDDTLTKLKNRLLNTMSNNKLLYDNQNESLYFTLCLAGISCPEGPKWCWEYKRNKSEIEIIVKKVSEIKTNTEYYYIDYEEKYNKNEESEIQFFRCCGKWRQCSTIDGPQDTINIKWLLDKGDSEVEGGNLAAKKILELCKTAEDGLIYIMFENSGISSSSSDFLTTANGLCSIENMDFLWYGCMHPYNTSEIEKQNHPSTKDDPWQYEKAWTEGMLYKTGYNRVHQENKRRFCGQAYIKKEGVYINIAKYILSDKSNQTVSQSTAYEGKNKELFDLEKYDFTTKAWADAFLETLSTLDDRTKIQNTLFGVEKNFLHQWTVTLGDVTFFVPPTNITCQSIVENHTMPYLRAKGSGTKSGKREYRRLTLQIYFNEERGINGYPYTTTLPGPNQKNDIETTYYINGLRSLVAQFKFTPFLPIENDYINDTLNIKAVLFENINISHVPDFPRLYVASVTMQEFDYGTYMPELDYYMTVNGADLKSNYFSKSFNWPVMRYYYQRCIRRGQTIADNEYIFNTNDYNDIMLGNRTALIPMAFKSNYITFYTPNTDDLDELLAYKLKMMSGKNQQYLDMDDNELKATKQLAYTLKAIKEAIADAKFTSNFKKAQEKDGKIKLKMLSAPIGWDIDPYDAGIQTFSNQTSLLKMEHSRLVKRYEDKDDGEDFNNCMEDAFSTIKDKLSGVNKGLGEGNEIIANATDGKNPIPYCNYSVRKVEQGNGYDIYYGITIKVGSDYLCDENNIKKLKADGESYAGVKSDKYFKDGKLYIPFKAHFSKSDNDIAEYICTDGFALDTESPDYKFLEFCEKAENLNKADKDREKKEKSISMGSLSTIRFNKYEVNGFFLITDFSAALVNHLSRVNLNNVSGTAAQYLGGEDTIFNFSIETTNRSAVEAILALPKYMSKLIHDYHAILPYAPLRVCSEFTQFLGVQEVVIENVQVVTSDQQTGVYSLNLSLKSCDRTVRDKEAMTKTQLDNAGYNRGQNEIELKVKTYWQLKDMLSAVDVYPDLELPTLKEMSNVGYDFLKYKFQDGRKYVDPDFYFVYPYALISQLTREYVLNNFNSNKRDIMFLDKSGAKITINPSDHTGCEISSQNEEMKAQMKMLQEIDEKENAGRNASIKHNLRRMDNLPLAGLEGRENWNICENITPIFLEKTYKDAYDRYIVDAQSNNNATANNQNNADANTQKNKTEGQEEDLTVKTSVVSKVEYGKFVYDKLENARIASKKIEDYLKTVSIESLGEQYKANDRVDAKAYNIVQKLYFSKYTNQDDYGYYYDIHNEYTGKDAEVDEKERRKRLLEVADTYGPNNGITGGINISSKVATVQKQNPKTGQWTSEINTEQLQEQTQESTSGYTRNSVSNKGPEKSDYQACFSEIDVAINDFFNSDKINDIIGYINIDKSSQFMLNVKSIIKAAACAVTGNKEYCAKYNPNYCSDWAPDFTFIGHTAGKLGMDVSKKQRISKIADVGQAITFGCFGIKVYTYNQIIALTGDKTISKKVDTDTKDFEKKFYCLDPYYRDKIHDYQKLCASNIKACTIAFLRNVLYWLKKLIDCQVFPAMIADIFDQAAINELEKLKLFEDNKVDNESSRALKTSLNFVRKNIPAIDSGKIWTATILAITDNSANIRNNIEQRNYKGLNSFTDACLNPNTYITTENKVALRLRKMGLALEGLGQKLKRNIDNVNNSNPASEIMRQTLELKYLAAADDPSQFIPHSFHDAIVNDARGRMLRAFPTFYMCFIDEGRDIGRWRLHDNFYTTSAIMNMQIVKSRKLPADTARITMSNLYGGFTTENEMMMQNALTTHASLDDIKPGGVIFNSLFDKEAYATDLENKRSKQPHEDRIILRPGARIHIRLGYGANPEMLPVVFNGTVAEVSTEDTVEIIAQGDGVELTNPINEDAEATCTEDSQFFHDNNQTPRKLIQNLLTYHGGYINKMLKDNAIGQFMEQNPFGIYHFGSQTMQMLSNTSNGFPEITQNIFEGVNTPYWGDMKLDNEGSSDTINIQIFQRTPWEIINICRSASPNFICGVAPFDFRSTLFHGAPRFYYAYSYMKDESGLLMEKRKPYEQYHIYGSSHDIIANGITATSSKMKTVVTAMYSTDFISGSQQRHTEPVYADIDIYPEYQKTMVYDTGLYGKTTVWGSGLLSSICNMEIGGFSLSKTLGNEERGSSRSAYWTARSMAISGLAESMKDMYCGDIVLLGDPSLKPLDKVYISDGYQGITGSVGVKEVVHSLNVNDGFITTFSPDCIVKANDKFEVISNEALRNIGSHWGTLATGALYASMCAFTNSVPTVKSALNALSVQGLISNGIASLEKTAAGQNGVAQTLAQKTLNFKDSAVGAIKKVKIGRSALALFGSAFGVTTLAMATQYVISRSISTYMNEKIRNMSAVSVYPVERFNLPYTAGLVGSQGLIISDHATNLGNGIKSALVNCYDNNPLVNMIVKIFGDEETENAINEIRVKAGITDSHGNPMMKRDLETNKYSILAAEAVGADNYNSLFLKPRAQAGTVDKNIAQKHFEITSTKHWQSNPKLQNFRQISKDENLKPYIQEEFLMILHEAPTLENNNNIENQIIYLPNGEEYYIKVIATQKASSNNNETDFMYNIPMLHPDALSVLHEIVRRTKKLTAPFNKGDDHDSNDKNKSKRIVVTSALNVGVEGDPSTGFTFALQVTGDLEADFRKAVDSFNDEVHQTAAENGILQKDGATPQSLFEEKINGSEHIFVVYPPKVSCTFPSENNNATESSETNQETNMNTNNNEEEK